MKHLKSCHVNTFDLIFVFIGILHFYFIILVFVVIIAGAASVVNPLEKLFEHRLTRLPAVSIACFGVECDLAQSLDGVLVVDDSEEIIDFDQFVQNSGRI